MCAGERSFVEIWGDTFWFGKVSMTCAEFCGVMEEGFMVWQCGEERYDDGDEKAV